MKNNNNEITQNEVDNIINWLKEYFQKNSFLKGAVLGMSGGKDSLIVAELLIRAIGKERVFGIIMPNQEMPDIDDAIDTCKLLDIKYEIVNIGTLYKNYVKQYENVLEKLNAKINSVTTQNTPPRIRMSFLYGIAGSLGYVVANTSNLSEIMVGYSTKWGDGVGDLAPIANYTKTEVCQIGMLLGLPEYLVQKTPADGLSGKTDEDNLGITYTELDGFIRNGIVGENFERIAKMHKNNLHKIYGMIKYNTNKSNYFDNLKG
jgi:NAD+ synthase